MAMYQSVLQYKTAASGWLELASQIEPDHPAIKQTHSDMRFSHETKNRVEYFPPSLLIFFDSDEQDLIDAITPLLPIPCSIVPDIALQLKKQQGIVISPKAQAFITEVFDTGNEGGVVCTLEFSGNALPNQNLALSITHLIVKPKHKAEIRIQEYQRKRIAKLKKENSWRGK